jgi:hypothetical protein
MDDEKCELQRLAMDEAKVQSGDDAESTEVASRTASRCKGSPPGEVSQLLTPLLRGSKSDARAIEVGDIESQRPVLLPVEATFLLYRVVKAYSVGIWRAPVEPSECAATDDAPRDEDNPGKEVTTLQFQNIPTTEGEGNDVATKGSALSKSTRNDKARLSGGDAGGDVVSFESGGKAENEAKPGAEQAKTDSFDTQKWLIVLGFALYFLFILSVIVVVGSSQQSAR